MSQFLEKVEQLNKEGQRIRGLHALARSKEQAIREEAEKQVAEAFQEWRNESEKYKAELKAFAGVTEGEAISVLDVVTLIKRVQGME